MAVAMRDRWTDERLDDLNGKVDDGFKRMDERFAQIDGRFAKVDERFDRFEEKVDRRFDDQHAWMREEFGRTNARIDALSRTILQGTFALCAGMIALAAATLAGFVAVA